VFSSSARGSIVARRWPSWPPVQAGHETAGVPGRRHAPRQRRSIRPVDVRCRAPLDHRRSSWLVAFAGRRFIEPFERYIGRGWIGVAVVAVLGAGPHPVHWVNHMHDAARQTGSARSLANLAVGVLGRHGCSNAPLVPYIAWLSLRHRSFLTITCANPGIPLGGFVGESKYQILSSIKHPGVIETKLILAGDCRIGHRRSARAKLSASVFKPDVGQPRRRREARSIDRAGARLSHAHATKPSSPNRFIPDRLRPVSSTIRTARQPHGRIFSITRQGLPRTRGRRPVQRSNNSFGCTRVFRMQATTFLKRHADIRERVLSRGARFRLAIAGNHCQGTLIPRRRRPDHTAA
jgi:hypothetical protein